MPASKKTSGYEITIKTFVPADLGDMAAFQRIQKSANEAANIVEHGLVPVITPTRR